MINVQPYHDQLNKLQEYMKLFIDRESFMWINMECLPIMSPKELLRLFNETGCLIGDSFPGPPPPRFITFKEYCDDDKN